MSALRCSLFFVALAMMMVWNHPQVSAYTEEENFVFIDKILDLLNNNNECTIPTYEEVDELQASFDELEALYGDSLGSKLNNNQKLVRETLLDQWESFQKRMAAGVVIRTAKRRAFLCKIEQYQEAKYGSSICTSIKDNPGPISDHIFERNPIVRYLKHLETNDVPEFDPNVQPNGVGPEAGKRAEVIHTPINEISNYSPSGPSELDEGENKADDRKLENADHRDDYDPLADIPVPLVIHEPDEDPTLPVVSRPEEVPVPVPPPVTQPEGAFEVVPDVDGSKVEPEAQQVSGHQVGTDSKFDGKPELSHVRPNDGSALESNAGAESGLEKGSGNEFVPEHKSDSDLETSNWSSAKLDIKKEPIYSPEHRSESETETGHVSGLDLGTSDGSNSELDAKREPTHGPEHGLEVVTEIENKPEVEPELVPEFHADLKVVPETLNPAAEDPPHAHLDEPETKLVDDETDLADLSRLGHVFDGVDLRFGSLVWPDEQQTDNEETYDDSIKRAWQKFLNEQEIEDEEEKDRPSDPAQIQPSPPSYSRPSGKLRNRKKEFMRSVARDAELQKAEVQFGWVEYPQQGEEYRSNRWTTLADNNFCQLSVNRNYLKDSRGVKAIKSFGQNAKRRLMC